MLKGLFATKKAFKALEQDYRHLYADYEATKAREQENARRLVEAGLKPLKQGEF